MRKSVYQPIKKGEYWIGTNCFGVVHSEVGIDVVLRHWIDPNPMARFSKRAFEKPRYMETL